ncbi:MAG: type I restriction-modification enzyme R subunit C-terminal domain-containing protein, partial [Thermodesulfobacteriota bacterium]
PKSREAPGSRPDTTHAHDVLDAISQKIMRVLRRAAAKAEQNPQVRDKLAELENLWGVPPEELHRHLRELGPDGAAEFLKTHGRLVQQVGEVSRLIGSDRYPIISEHADELLNREQTYGPYDRPRDYLERFSDFIRNQVNESAALAVVVNRPRDLTRSQLREIRLLLDRHGFSEAKLRSAWRNQTNQEIAAGIIGHIRRAAPGEPLVPFARRVEGAMEKIYALHDWTPVQRKWLDRLAKQLVHEAVLDRDFVNRVFAQDGGDRRLDALLEERLDQVLDRLAESVWDAAG